MSRIGRFCARMDANTERDGGGKRRTRTALAHPQRATHVVAFLLDQGGDVMSHKKAKRKKVRKLYDKFVESHDRLCVTDPDLLKLAVVKHVYDCRYNNRALTTSGMALELGLSRETFLNFDIAECADERDPESLVAIVKTARAFVEIDLEHRLTTSATSAGAMFSLKANFGWRDVMKVSVGGGKNGDGPIEATTSIDPSLLSTDLLKELVAHRDRPTE